MLTNSLGSFFSPCAPPPAAAGIAELIIDPKVPPKAKAYIPIMIKIIKPSSTIDMKIK